MMDPNWARGFYYDKIPPHAGMKLAREIATVTYRSGPEWEQRFGRQRADPSRQPALCPDFLIETYLDHAGEKFCLQYDANSLLYVSKAMDLFDLGRTNQEATQKRRSDNLFKAALRINGSQSNSPGCTLSLPDKPYVEQSHAEAAEEIASKYPPADLVAGLRSLKDHQILVIVVAT